MKPLILSILTLLSVQSFAQETTKPSILLGVKANSIISFSDTPDRYSLFSTVNGGYYTNKTNQSSSQFFQLESEFRWDQFYVSGGLGVGLENIRLTATNLFEWADAGVGGSQSSRTTYDLSMREKHTYLIGSFEGGYVFSNPSNRFRLGFGLGMDFTADLSSSILENTLVRMNTTNTYISGGPNAGSTTTSTTEEFDNSSEEWMKTVGDSEIFWIMPRLGISSYYTITERFCVSFKANARFLFQRRYPGADLNLKVRYPVSLGIYFKL